MTSINTHGNWSDCGYSWLKSEFASGSDINIAWNENELIRRNMNIWTHKLTHLKCFSLPVSLVGSELHRAKNMTTSTNKSLINSKPVSRILSQRRKNWRVSPWRLSSFEGRLRLLFLGVQIEGRKVKWRANVERGDKHGPHRAFPPSTHLEQATKRRLWVHFLESTFSNNDPQKVWPYQFSSFSHLYKLRLLWIYQNNRICYMDGDSHSPCQCHRFF